MTWTRSSSTSGVVGWVLEECTEPKVCHSVEVPHVEGCLEVRGHKVTWSVFTQNTRVRILEYHSVDDVKELCSFNDSDESKSPSP